METPSQKQPNNLPSTQDKIPHGGERPDFELGPLNTGDVPRLVKELGARETVPDALIGRTAIEDTADRLAQPVNPTTEREAQPKERFGLGAKIGASAAGLVLLAGSAFGISKAMSGDSDANQPPASEPVATAPVNSTGEASPSAVETEAPIESEYSIPSGLDAKAFAEQYTKIKNSWLKAGSENIEDLKNEMLDGSDSQEIFWQKTAEKNAILFTTGLFGENWQSNPSVVELVNKMTELNANYLQLLFMTKYGPDKTVDKQAYDRWSEVQSVSEEIIDQSHRKITIQALDIDNSDQNRVEDNVLPTDTKVIITVTTVDGSDIITTAEF